MIATSGIEVVGVSVQLGTHRGAAVRADWRRDLVSVPAPRPVSGEADRPRPRWSQAVGAAVLLSVLDTLDGEDTTASA